MRVSIHIWMLSALALLAFAANSVLARMALLEADAGAWSFTLIRLFSGAVMLGLLVRGRGWRSGSWAAGACLLFYAACFSVAYKVLGAGAGALILFATVQFTMIGWGVLSGDRLGARQATGIGAAMGALVWWLSPREVALDTLSCVVMALSGAAWGAYSLLGRASMTPARATASNFMRATILAAGLTAMMLLFIPGASIEAPVRRVVWLAMISGALTSGLGYVIWYAALQGLSASQAGPLQLVVPVLAAGWGVLFLAEPLTWRFVVAAILILGGVRLAMLRSAPAV